MKHTEIKAATGLGAIKFGMTREDVSQLLGDPTDTDMFSDEDDPDGKVESWHYDEEEVSFAFDEAEGWRLTTIAVSSEAYTVEGIKPIGLGAEAIQAQFEQAGLGSIEPDSEDEFIFFAENLGLQLWFESGVCRELQWSPEINDADEIIWPV